jgi:hypothetical protein
MSVLHGRRGISALVLVLAVAPAAAGGQKPRTNPDAATIADFTKRVEAYAQLHRKIEDTLPKLPKEATPQQIDQHQRALQKLIQEQRADAKPGDLFTPGMQRIVRRLMRQVFRGEGGRQLKKEILEEYSEEAVVPLKVNGRYPDAVPLSTVPPQVLKGLPKLPEEIEYRFLGDRLILLDPHAHLIADYMERVFP